MIDVPALRYWMALDAIWPIGSFALAVWLAYLGVRAGLSRKHTYVLIAVFALLSLAGWWSTAQQAQNNDALLGQFRRIASVADVSSVDPSKIADEIIGKIKQRAAEIVPPPANQTNEYKISREWMPLSAEKISTLRGELGKAAPGEITFACATPYCKRLSDGLASAFRGAGWTVHIHHGGGMGVDGVAGVLMISCAERVSVLRGALAKVISSAIDARPEQNCSSPDFITIGEKPF
jgi:hypothetical protein